MTEDITVAQFIEFLKTQDQGAIVETIQMVASTYSEHPEFVPLNLEEHIDYTDLRDNSLVMDDEPRKTRRTLEIGSTWA